MKSILALIITPAFLLGGNVIGSGKLTSRSYNVKDFNAIEVAGNFEVNVKKGNNYKASVSGDDNLLQYVKAEIKNNKLVIKMELDYENKSPLVLNLQSPAIVDFSGHGHLKARISGYEEKQLKLSLKGSGNVDLQQSKVDSLQVNLIGNSSANLGKVQSVSGDISKGKNTLSLLQGTTASNLKSQFPSEVKFLKESK